MNFSIVRQLAEEFEAEIPASLKCIERIPEKLFEWKPHERSMNMGYLTLLVAEIPKWIASMIDVGVIDFQTYQHSQPSTTAEMVEHFKKNIEEAKRSLKNLKEEDLSKHFVLRNGEQVMIDSPLAENISSTINHWVHHRGQLTVYMRLNDIAVPSIYGPSADEKAF